MDVAAVEGDGMRAHFGLFFFLIPAQMSLAPLCLRYNQSANVRLLLSCSVRELTVRSMTLHQTLTRHPLDLETVLFKVDENPLNICWRHEQSSSGSTPRTVSPTRVEFPREEPTTLLRAQWNKDRKTTES